MKLQLFASTNSCNILRKYIKKAKENKKNDKTTITSKPKLHAKEPQKSHKTGKFIYASVKFVKTPQNQVQSLNSTKNIKFTISEINSLSNFNFFQPKPILKDEKPIKKETFCLEKEIAQCTLDSDCEDTCSLTCCEQLPSFEDSFNSKTRNLMELFEQTYKKKIEKGSDNFLREISKIESEYKVHENYLKDFEENQLNWSMRAILVDWMFEVADDFKLKRDTCYDAVNILDRFLQTKSNIIQKKNLQGIAITVLHIAAKKEEIHPPKLKDFINLCNDEFDQKTIVQFELVILQKIQWKLHPITLNFWLNFCLSQWEIFVNNNLKKYTIFAENIDLFMFFNHQADSFINYRILTGYLDSTLLDLDSYKINSKILIIVFLYLLISGNYANLEKTKKFLGSSDLDETLQYNTNFNEIFNEFLTEKLETNIDEIFTASKYANKFMKLPINYEVVAENFDKTIAFDFQKNYNHNLSFQIFNKNSLEFVRKVKDS